MEIGIDDGIISPDEAMFEHGFTPASQFSVHELGKYPVVIASHKFYTRCGSSSRSLPNSDIAQWPSASQIT